MNILFHPDAEGEFNDAIYWYEQQRKGLGADFFLCVDEALERIKKNPTLYPTINKQIHRCIVHRFPFAILYEIEHADIKVLGVFHSKRNPQRWQERK
ncbi:MAG: type II toxin-antitoxin system RelE/ParE family toxin [Ignavibacteriales bacterium]|nr:type II toxin-antitoxin system RelE/ParE family toxin [Ignavibacteriales bacterium]